MQTFLFTKKRISLGEECENETQRLFFNSNFVYSCSSIFL